VIQSAFMRTLWGEIAPAAIHPIRTKRGSKVEIEWHNAVLRGAGGNVCAALSIGLDVTKRRQVDGSRRLATVGEFAAGVAREITNPVDTIVNCAMLLLDGSPVSDNCRIILDEGARISGIGKHLLQFTRGARGAPQPTSLAEVVGRAVGLLGEEFERHGIRLQVEVPRDLPPVLAHPQQLQQVLLNLLTNAKDAFQLTWTGSRLVTVRAGVDDGTTVSCCVRDNGPGIARDLATHIFEPFMTTNRERGGAGLGLFVSRSIIESFGGRLTVQSVPGEFAEFTLELPQTANY
jgi:signal transduction histidine kinase